MKKNIVLYYILILSLVMGAFASMALNNYGVALMSYAALGFSFVFLYEFISVLLRPSAPATGKAKIMGLELVTLFVLCLLYFFRGLMIEIPFSAGATMVLLIVLLVVNAYHLYQAWKNVEQTPFKLKGGVMLYFAALIFLIGTMISQGIFAILLSTVAFVCLIAFIVIGWWKGTVIVEGEETSALHEVSQFKNKSGVQLIGFALLIAYSSLNALRLLPPLYFGSMPNGYSKVVRQAQNPTEKQIDPKAFEDAYKKFIEGK